MAAVVLGYLLFPGARVAAQDWPPITDEEKALKDCPQQPGSAAVFLYREEATSQENFATTYFYRLKILTPAGRERANIEIPVYKGWMKITGLNARVVRPDGVAVPYSGPVFEKTVLRTGQLKVTVKTFALPDVDVGSIIDYRYTVVPDTDKSSRRAREALVDFFGNAGKPEEGGIATDGGILFLPVDTWALQTDLFTQKAKFSYEPWALLGTALAEWSRRRVTLSWVTRWVGNAQPGGDSTRVELQLTNIPAFEAEEFMPPESSQRMEVRLFYIATAAATPDDYWREESLNWRRGVEKFMGKAALATEFVKVSIAGLDDPAAKLRALYESAQKIRNLSYDRTMTGRKRQELGIKDNRSVDDVIRKRYGLRSDITRTFAALAAAAGFEARIVRVATRDDKLFELNLCDLYSQFDTELAVVRIDGRDRFYDPATPYCPPGLVPWNCLSTVMLDQAGDPPSVLKAPLRTPAGTPEDALIRREIALRLDADGSLAGTAKVRFAGQEGLMRRLEHLNDNEVEVKTDLEAELGEILPAGAKVTLQKVENLRDSTNDLLADFEIVLPGMVTRAGDRTLLPVSPLQGLKRYPFRHSQRHYPVSFAYPRRESDDIVISLPGGMAVEATPAPRSESTDAFDHSLTCTVENGTTLHVRREIGIKKCDFAAFYYGDVRSFFDRVRAADEEQVALSAAEKEASPGRRRP